MNLDRKNNIIKNQENRFAESTNGITLISLVVTIIVLLILAGVSIATLIGNNGLLLKAEESKEKTEESQDKEKIEMAVIASQIEESSYQKLNHTNLQNAIDNQFGKNKATVIDNGNGTFTVSFLDSKKDYNITPNGVEKGIDWNLAMQNVRAPKSQVEERNNGVIGIGTDGNPVNMDLWDFTLINNGNSVNLNSEDTINKVDITSGYKGNCLATEIVIPQYISIDNGKSFKPVTDMYRTFVNCTDLEETPQIPYTVINMPATFQGCSSLKKITSISGQCTNLLYTFQNCIELESINISFPNSIVDMSGAFTSCENLKNIPEFPCNVENLQSTYAFCNKLNSVKKIPDTVTNMCQTFWHCSALGYIEITIPEKCSNVHQTFGNCENLTGIITVDSNPTEYLNFLQNTKNEIILKGNSNMLDILREYRTNIKIE